MGMPPLRRLVEKPQGREFKLSDGNGVEGIKIFSGSLFLSRILDMESGLTELKNHQSFINERRWVRFARVCVPDTLRMIAFFIYGYIADYRTGTARKTDKAPYRITAKKTF
jgi:hypothetical protein